MPKLPPLAHLLPLVALLAACEQQRHPAAVITSSPASMKQLEGTWLQSQEENSDDTLVYRPNTYRFPPTRGRTGFRIGSYGRFEQYDIAPTDGLTARDGTWTAAGDNRLRIHLSDKRTPDYTFEILSLTNRSQQKMLKLRRQP